MISLPPFPAVMGIVNVTPDSFSDGGRFFDADLAVQHALAMEQAGATILDVGGESTRPGSKPVSIDEELRRVIPVIERLAGTSSALISIDTSKPEVMTAATNAGAHLINDVNALQSKGAMSAAASSDAFVCLMHKQGTPETMQTEPQYCDVVEEVSAFLQERVEDCRQAGIDSNRLMIDPGFGFGKSVEHNWQLLTAIGQFKAFGSPVLVGLSRKSMFAELASDVPSERLPASLAAAALAVAQGADIVRCHDVAETLQAVETGHRFRAAARR